MLNLFYRGYVIHEDIRSICYTVYGAKPDRAEMRSRGTVMEAMKWVDRDLAQVRPCVGSAVTMPSEATTPPAWPSLLSCNIPTANIPTVIRSSGIGYGRN